MCRCFEKIRQLSRSWDLFWLYLHFVAFVAELADPDLLTTLINQCRFQVEDTFALLAKACITCGKLATVLQDIKLHFKDVCVELYLVIFAILFVLLLAGALISTNLASDGSA